ncbi:hypothetical protein N9L02_03490, partial [Gammaproteobacteria bacterium]|nr:hypothetical protein [Gammaproteobacteria bacterium]
MAFSIFAFGTGEHYDKSKVKEDNSQIRTFYDACQGPKLYVDGPQGVRDPQSMQSNTDSVIKAIKSWLKFDQSGDIIVNLTGYSRGSVTCLWIANALNDLQEIALTKKKDNKELTEEDKKLLKLRINIFANDPVAGLLDKGELESKKIPKIVKEYVATISLDEDRKLFAPQDLTRVQVEDREKTNVVFLPVFGRHSIATKSGDKSELKKYHIFLIIANLRYKFFKAHGTKFKSPPDIATEFQSIPPEFKDFPNWQLDLKEQDLLDLYTLAWNNREDYFIASDKEKNGSFGFPHKRSINNSL